MRKLLLKFYQNILETPFQKTIIIIFTCLLVPVGFIYTQLPGQVEPQILWPLMTWKDVTSDYAGLFFRAEGGGAAPFGKVQSDNSPRLSKIEQKTHGSGTDSDSMQVIPGTWSSYMFTGKFESPNNHLRFFVSSEEVRPRNKAMRIWKRKN